MSDPKWKTIQATDYYFIQEDETGVYGFEMEVAEDRGDGKFDVFRFELERFKVVEVADRLYLVPARYDPATYPHPLPQYEAWFAKDLEGIADSVGMPKSELREAFCSLNLVTRAGAYQSLGGYHGYMNLDQYPLTLTEEELNERWSK